MLHPLLLLVGLSLLVMAGIVLFSPSARLRRRLKKTHSRVVAKAPRPMVRLSVKTRRRK